MSNWQAKKPCRYISTPQGCRAGNACPFAHPPTDRAGAVSPSAASPGKVRDKGKSKSQDLGILKEGNLPNGACRIFWKHGNCKYGATCSYKHTFVDPSVLASLSPRDREKIKLTITENAATRASSPPVPATPVPNGICRIWWTSGQCRFEFQCRYKHTAVAPTVRPQRAQSSGDGDSNDGADDTPSPSTVRRSFTVPISHGETRMSPTEAHANMTRFLNDNFRFKAPWEIYAFLKSVISATVPDTRWAPEDYQLFFQTLAKGTGLQRLVDILTWSDIATSTGDKATLSFQAGMIPIFQFMASDTVVKSTLREQSSSLWHSLIDNLDRIVSVITACMTDIMQRKSFADFRRRTPDDIGIQFFVATSTILHEMIIRFKNVAINHPLLVDLFRSIHEWFGTWKDGVTASPASFGDPLKNIDIGVRTLLLASIDEKFDRIRKITERDQNREKAAATKSTGTVIPRVREGIIAALEAMYEGPGEVRQGGPRHDNDHVNIDEIRIAPTHEELMSRIKPFLPANIYGAPHPAPPETPQRLLDIQFRLLREELTAPLRQAVQNVTDDLLSHQRSTQLSELLKKGGGKYKGHTDGSDGLLFNVYSDVAFKSLVPDRRGITTSLVFKAPPGKARSDKGSSRVAFWEGMSGKRLTQGGLIALVWKSGSGEISVNLGTIASSVKDISEHVRNNAETVAIRIAFFDASLELRILQQLQNRGASIGDVKFIVESPILFEAIRPFLESLKMEPEILPFAEYLVHRSPTFFQTSVVHPPKFARLSGTALRLDSLLKPDSMETSLALVATDRDSVQHARDVLRESSYLDPSQADSVVDALTHEVSLIQGPPGTGKSYTGLQLLRVLLDNDIGPILMIAFTNHALDHMLTSVLDAGITKKIVRLGSRSADERVQEFSLEHREMAAGRGRLEAAFNDRYRNFKDAEKALNALLKEMLQSAFASESSEIVKYMDSFFGEHSDNLAHPPEWIADALARHEQEREGWIQQGAKNRAKSEDLSTYALWRNAVDLNFLDFLDEDANNMQQELEPATADAELAPSSQARNPFQLLSVEEGDSSSSSSDSEEEEEEDEPYVPPLELRWMHDLQVQAEAEAVSKMAQLDSLATIIDPIYVPASDTPPAAVSLAPAIAQTNGPDHSLTLEPTNNTKVSHFLAYGYSQPPIRPSTERVLEHLLEDGDVWNMSQKERETLHEYWHGKARTALYETRLLEFERLRERHADRLRDNNEGKEEVKRQLMKNVDIIGCTTTGAAKVTSLLKGLEPRVLLVEEAGQVLEAHVLGSLVPSIEHVILIGDPLQLRPTLNNFSLSMDNREGRELYRFDMSMMERLSSSGFPMSQINVQRRMRPSISSLIRNTLYPQLQDHELVQDYPHVRGIAKDVYFFTHTHAENGGTDDALGASKYNTFEVSMIKDLVLYLLRQGCYSQEGDIVVLCAYLGQLARMRDALRDEVAVVIDERDQADLADQEDAGKDGDSEDEALGGQIERVQVTKRVRLRTVDNYQGEEANIVILSLVRNSGALDDEMEALGMRASKRSNIGFLKSENRTNVALSRARHGLYVFGNAANLAARSKMWRTVIEELDAGGSVGSELPIRCERHPDRIEQVSNPGVLPKIAPDGGCMQQCTNRLKCGHLCPYKCHGDDPKHISITCVQKCRRLCPRGHPCAKDCAEACGNCTFPIKNVELPCGHTKERVYCYQMDDLANVTCDAQVVKKLTKCEHEATLRCSEDPASVRCKAPCDTIMSCCGKMCPRRCWECQPLNASVAFPTTDAAAPELIIDEPKAPAPRLTHVKHMCQKRLYCEHPCQEYCSDEHEHSKVCKKSCRQVCQHAQCGLACSSPCAPCQEPCTWRCRHYECPVPCGSVCVRLPCDKRCEEQLRCGHRCPSVCGEDCDTQICADCATKDQKSSVVDFILQLTLEDVNPDEEGLDNLLITLPRCKHVFTVETLDGICWMSEYYTQNREGDWSGLSQPPHGIKQPPTCPTCREAITSPRYGRVFKRARLDISERNVASQMSKDLQSAQNLLSRFSVDAAQNHLKTAASKLVGPSKKKKQEFDMMKTLKVQSKVLGNPLEQAISPRDLHVGNRIHRIDVQTQDAWRKAARPLIDAYNAVSKITETRSAHLHAWEAAFSCLYQQELESYVRQQRAPAHPEENAMRVARMTVGQPRPLADRRFVVEALWMSVEIRLRMTRLGQSWLDAAASDAYPSSCRAAWGSYLSFLFSAALRDAKVALSIAGASNSRRQVTSSALLILRVELEHLSYNLAMSKKTNFDTEARKDFAQMVEQRIQEVHARIGDTMVAHFQGVDLELLAGERAWFQENFREKAQLIADEWENILVSVRMDTFYQPVSLEEKMQIVKAMAFGHAGHFYNCPNGHMYTITECGGAMQRAHCPECGLAIGGESHHLDPSNSRATEFETLALQAGARETMWPAPH